MKKNILLVLIFCLLILQFGCEKNSEIETAREKTQLNERDKLTSGERPKYKKGVTKPKVENSESYTPKTRQRNKQRVDKGKYYEIINDDPNVFEIELKEGYYFFSFYIASSEDGSYKRISGTDGYIPIDLNEDAGGNYMYLNFKLTEDRNWAITEIAVDSYTSVAYYNIALPEQPTVYFSDNNYSFSQYHRDLNYHAGGSYVYFSFTRNSHPLKLRSIAISRDESFGSYALVYGDYSRFDWIWDDLNHEAGGTDIFIGKDREDW